MHGPITVSRQSKIGPVTIPRQHACKHRYDRKPKVSKPPAPSHHRSPTLSQTVRRHGHGLRCTAQSPFLDSRKSVPSPSHANTCVQASVWPETRGKQTACNMAPRLTDTLADCAPPRARPHHRFSTVENRSRHHPTPTHACKHRYDRKPKVSKPPATLHHRSPTLSQHRNWNCLHTCGHGAVGAADFWTTEKRRRECARGRAQSARVSGSDGATAQAACRPLVSRPVGVAWRMSISRSANAWREGRPEMWRP